MLSPVNLGFVGGDVNLHVFPSLGLAAMKSIVCDYADVANLLGFEFSF